MMSHSMRIWYRKIKKRRGVGGVALVLSSQFHPKFWKQCRAQFAHFSLIKDNKRNHVLSIYHEHIPKKPHLIGIGLCIGNVIYGADTYGVHWIRDLKDFVFPNVLSSGLTKGSLILLRTPGGLGFRKLCRLWRKKVTRGLQHGAGLIIEHGSHRAARSDGVRRAFSYDGRIVGCRIVYKKTKTSKFTDCYWVEEALRPILFHHPPTRTDNHARGLAHPHQQDERITCQQIRKRLQLVSKY
ncbi:hypothetical protein YC2023_077765 [Brassica napus]